MSREGTRDKKAVDVGAAAPDGAVIRMLDGAHVIVRAPDGAAPVLTAERNRLAECAATVLDIYADSELPYEHRVYVEGAFKGAMTKLAAALATFGSPDTPNTSNDVPASLSGLTSVGGEARLRELLTDARPCVAYALYHGAAVHGGDRLLSEIDAALRSRK